MITRPRLDECGGFGTLRMTPSGTSEAGTVAMRTRSAVERDTQRYPRCSQPRQRTAVVRANYEDAEVVQRGFRRARPVRRRSLGMRLSPKRKSAKPPRPRVWREVFQRGLRRLPKAVSVRLLGQVTHILMAVGLGVLAVKAGQETGSVLFAVLTYGMTLDKELPDRDRAGRPRSAGPPVPVLRPHHEPAGDRSAVVERAPERLINTTVRSPKIGFRTDRSSTLGDDQKMRSFR